MNISFNKNSNCAHGHRLFNLLDEASDRLNFPNKNGLPFFFFFKGRSIVRRKTSPMCRLCGHQTGQNFLSFFFFFKNFHFFFEQAATDAKTSPEMNRQTSKTGADKQKRQPKKAPRIRLSTSCRRVILYPSRRTLNSGKLNGGIGFRKV